MYISNGSGMTYLENTTVSNAQSFTNDPIEVFGGADISNITVSGTWPASTGTAVYITSSSRPANVSGLTVKDIKYGNGLYIYNSTAEPTVIDGLNISETQSPYGNGGGAHIYVRGSLSITNAAISETQSPYGNGGGLYIDNDSAQPTVIENLNISDTTSNGSGGGAYISAGGDLSIADVNISNTTSISFGHSGGGADISAGGHLSITKVDISGTQSSGPGGGIFIGNGSAEPTVISGLNISNTTSTSSGGGADIRVSGSLSITDTDINETQASNYSSGGLGIINWSAQPTVINGLRINNAKATGSNAGGGGAFIDTFGGGSLSITDTIISNCSAPNSTGGALIAALYNFSVINTTVNGFNRSGAYNAGAYAWP
jgi:hypothetical protein